MMMMYHLDMYLYLLQMMVLNEHENDVFQLKYFKDIISLGSCAIKLTALENKYKINGLIFFKSVKLNL